MRYQPSKGYSWDIKSQSSGAGILKKDVKEEPSSNFQRQRVDMLLMELTKRFPLPVIRPPPQEGKYALLVVVMNQSISSNLLFAFFQ